MGNATTSSMKVQQNRRQDAVVTFTNTHENNKWLNDTANMPNVFGKKEDE